MTGHCINFQNTNFRLTVSADRQIGFIAQEVMRVLPEAVSQAGGDYYMATGAVVPVLVEAIKEQQQIIANQNEEIAGIKSKLAEFEAALQKLQVLPANERKP